MLRVLGAFGLQQPTSTAGAQLLRALALERSSLYAAWGGPNPCDVEANMHKTITTAKAAGFGTTHPAMCEALRAPMVGGRVGLTLACAVRCLFCRASRQLSRAGVDELSGTCRVRVCVCVCRRRAVVWQASAQQSQQLATRASSSSSRQCS
jgi:hypothetical protein